MADIFRLDGKVATVIGGNGGLGKAMAFGLAQYGARVAIAARDLPRLEEAAQEIGKNVGAEVAPFKFDITDEKSVAHLVQQVVSRFGRVDILVNAHGTITRAPTAEVTVADWDLMFDVNVRGIMLTSREFAKVMIAQKSGKIINLSSVRGVRAAKAGGTGYCATKGAVDAITRGMAAELGPYRINVNAIAPAVIRTAFTEALFKRPELIQGVIDHSLLGRVGEPEDIIGACVFLASPASDFITGQIIYVDAGYTAIA